MDPDLFMCHMDTFFHYSLCFSSSYFFPKDIIIPSITDNCMIDFPHHHSIMYSMSSLPYILLFAQHSPVICKDFFSLVYMYKSSGYCAVSHIDLGSIFPWSTSL